MQHRGALLNVMGGRRIRWLLRDEFSTALAAGSVNGTNAEPGPGVRTVVDTGNQLSISGGALVYAATTGAYDPRVVYAAQVRIPGKMLFCKWIQSDGRMQFNWGASASQEREVLRTDASRILIANKSIGIALTAGTTYYGVIILRSTGSYILYKPSGSNWTLLPIFLIGIDDTLNPVYPSISTLSAGANTPAYDFIRVPTNFWLPTPLLSDGFGSTFGTSDGLGHAEGIAGGLGAGGGGLTWLGLTTWAIAAGVVANTPVEGADLLLKGDFEDWTSPTNLTDWVEGIGGTSTVNQEAVVIHGGTYSVRFDIDASNTAVQIYKASGGTLGNWYQLNFWGKASAAGKTLKTGGYLGVVSRDPGTTFTEYVQTGRCGADTNVYFKSDSAASASLYFDDVTIKLLPISTLIANQQLATTDVLAEEIISAYTLGSQAGICQSDRPFGFQANADAAAGQPVIVLKGLTHAVPDTDTLTIKHPITPTTYTIASVSALVDGVQTITLDDNLVEAVSEDDWVGVDWASWNGVIWYFNGAGNLDTVQVLAGAYSAINSSAKAFSADARLIAWIIGTEARIFYAEALIYTGAGTIDAACLAGQYFGMFSTLAANTFSSFVAHDTGAKTNCHSILDRYSRD